jgi:hypothetical protein
MIRLTSLAGNHSPCCFSSGTITFCFDKTRTCNTFLFGGDYKKKDRRGSAVIVAQGLIFLIFIPLLTKEKILNLHTHMRVQGLCDDRRRKKTDEI